MQTEQQILPAELQLAFLRHWYVEFCELYTVEKRSVRIIFPAHASGQEFLFYTMLAEAIGWTGFWADDVTKTAMILVGIKPYTYRYIIEGN